MDLFISSYNNKLDKKSRISIPVSFRTILGRQPICEVFAIKSFFDNAIDCFTYNRMQRISEKIDENDFYSEKYKDLTSVFFAGTVSLGIDPEGRIAISDDFSDHIKLQKGDIATIAGKGHYFQIWNKKEYDNCYKSSYENTVKDRDILKFALGR